MKTKIKINDNGYVTFAQRNWSFAGDKQTWVRFDGDKMTVAKSRRGTISSAYADAIDDFLNRVNAGFTFADVGYGERKSVDLDLDANDLIMQ